MGLLVAHSIVIICDAGVAWSQFLPVVLPEAPSVPYYKACVCYFSLGVLFKFILHGIVSVNSLQHLQGVNYTAAEYSS
jgi:hypothetical protein